MCVCVCVCVCVCALSNLSDYAYMYVYIPYIEKAVYICIIWRQVNINRCQVFSHLNS